MSRLAVALDALREAQADAPEELLQLLRQTEFDSVVAGGCPSCWSTGHFRPALWVDGKPRAPAHLAACRIAYWMRVFGGTAETQRQANAAHEAALGEVRPGFGLGRPGPEQGFGWLGGKVRTELVELPTGMPLLEELRQGRITAMERIVIGDDTWPQRK